MRLSGEKVHQESGTVSARSYSDSIKASKVMKNEGKSRWRCQKDSGRSSANHVGPYGPL